LGLENFASSDPDPIEGTISTAATLGPQLRGGFSLLRLDLEGKISSEQIEGKSLVTIGNSKKLSGTIGKIEGNTVLNWDKKFFETKGNLSLLDGLIKSKTGFRADSDFNIKMNGNASVNVPEVIPYIGNQTLTSSNFLLDFSNDDNLTNDFVAGWGTISDMALGFKVYFDGEWDLLGMEDIPTAGKNFRVKEDKDTLLLNANWQEKNPRSAAIETRNNQSNVPIEVQTPDGKWIKESQFAANNIKLVENLGDSTQKTVLISNPQAGKWDIRVAKDGLGKVEYSALQNTSGAPTLELKAAVVDEEKSKVTIDYKAFDANSQAEISFFYDTDNQDFNGILIQDGVVEKDKKGRFVWNTEDVPDGKYYVYGTIQDENNLPAMTYSPIEITVGNPLPDGKIKVGNNKNNKLKGTGKDDILDGKRGNDKLYAQNGDDTLIGGGGKDILNGGGGNDTYKLNAKSARGSLIIDSKGKDTLELSNANISLNGLAKRKTGFAAIGKNLVIDINRDGKANSRDLTVKNFFASNKANKAGKGFIETVDNVSGDAIIDALNDTRGIVKNGNNKNNTLKGSNKDDLLNGKGGNDKLYGKNGDDILIGGGGKDILNGGGGDDTYKLNAKNARGSLIIDSKGKDTLELDGANISLNGLAKRKTGFAAIGKNLVIDINRDGKANSRDLTVKNFFASNKADKAGKGFIETVDNVSGNQVIKALGKNKVQRRSNEIAEDTLIGGGGEYGSEVEDAITDFIIGQADRIYLPGDQFLKLDPDIDFAEKFAAVGSDEAAATSDAYIAYNSNNGNLFYNANGDKAGFGAGGLFAALEGAPDLGATDFAIQP
jgi:Ca2+-binding RTX toxin-like protein